MTNEVKNVPQLRFPNFDGEWEEKQLGDITKTNQGLQIAISDRKTKYEKGLYFYITNEFLRPNSQTKYYIENPPESVVAEKSDILMTRTGNTGKVITNVEGAFHNNFFKIKYNKSIIDRLFLFELLKSPKINNKFLSLAGTSTIPDLNHSDFYSVYISFPTISEQQKISTFFSKLDRQIELEEQKLAKLEEQKKGYMQQIFSQKLRFKDECGNDYPNWETKKLEDVANYRRGSFPQPYGNKEWYDDISGEPFVQVYDVDSNMKLNKETKQKISEKAKPKSVKGFKDDIVVTLQGSIGRVAILQYDAYIDRTLLLINSFKFPVNKGYFKYILYLLFLREKERAPGGTIKTITKSVLSNFKIQIPALEEQEKIGNFFEKIDYSIEKQSDKVELLKTRKQVFLQKMFV